MIIDIGGMRMVKSVSERLAAWVAKKKKLSPGAQNRIAFLTVRREVEQALADGWPVKTIWEMFREEGRMTCSYPAFLGYANRLIRSREQADQPGGALKESAPVGPTTDASTPGIGGKNSTKPAGIAGFRVNPEPKKEDLL